MSSSSSLGLLPQDAFNEIFLLLDPASSLAFALTSTDSTAALAHYRLHPPPPRPRPRPRTFLYSSLHHNPYGEDEDMSDENFFKLGSDEFLYACAKAAKSRDFLLWAEEAQRKPLSPAQVPIFPPFPEIIFLLYLHLQIPNQTREMY